ncbi:MAG: hypothetical protein HC833_10820 [Leptolyngbyaceae cyanobacterium RM1_406_9]|nr:hypothetical protein [Leptolyngbyaceae cyanobacterium RM1_406_9]
MQDEVSRNGACTNNRFKESKETIGTPTANGQGEHLVQAQNPLMELVIGAGMHSNKTIQRILRELEQQLDPADAKRAVENAVSALQEQQAQGTVRNPGGFLVAALRGNFTANESKRNARKKQGDSQNGSTSTTLSPEKNNRYGFPESSPPADLSDVIAEISVHRNRLGWTKEQTIAYMVERHGWRKVAFSALTDADLIALSRELQSL